VLKEGKYGQTKGGKKREMRLERLETGLCWTLIRTGDSIV
jgi:hypothetical protein